MLMVNGRAKKNKNIPFARRTRTTLVGNVR